MPLTDCFHLSAPSRRHFFQSAVASALVVSADARAAGAEANVLGPVPGYSPQIGTLVSEMTWMRDAVLRSVEGLTQDQVDFLLDSKANRIGALLFHLAATEKLYQLNTFDHVGMQELEKGSAFKDWAVAMELGEPARKTIKGHTLDYYRNILHELREKTLAELRTHEQSVQVVPRLRARIAPRRTDRPAEGESAGRPENWAAPSVGGAARLQRDVRGLRC